MKNTTVILLFIAAFFVFGCNDTENETAINHTDTTAHDVVMIDYSTMTFADQEADMNERLIALRNHESMIAEPERNKYRLEVDNLQNNIILFRAKRMDYEKDENESLKEETQSLGDKIRESADRLKTNAEEVADQLRDDHNQKVEDVKGVTKDIEEGTNELAEDIQDESKRIKEKLKEDHNQKVKDVNEALGK